jgi:hypothetical protein
MRPCCPAGHRLQRRAALALAPGRPGTATAFQKQGRGASGTRLAARCCQLARPLDALHRVQAFRTARLPSRGREGSDDHAPPAAPPRSRPRGLPRPWRRPAGKRHPAGPARHVRRPQGVHRGRAHVAGRSGQPRAAGVALRLHRALTVHSDRSAVPPDVPVGSWSPVPSRVVALLAPPGVSPCRPASQEARRLSQPPGSRAFRAFRARCAFRARRAVPRSRADPAQAVGLPGPGIPPRGRPPYGGARPPAHLRPVRCARSRVATPARPRRGAAACRRA